MGCTASRHHAMPEGPAAARLTAAPPAAAPAGKSVGVQQWPSGNFCVVVDKDAEHGIPPDQQRILASGTTIHDLPPHLLAKILSHQDSWADLFRSIPLVCTSWAQLSHQATPERLAFEFDVRSQSNQQQQAQSVLLQRLHRILQRPMQPQQQQQKPAMMLGDGVPWAAWLQQHSHQVKELSVSIIAAGPECSASQCSLKQMALQAFAAASTSSTSAGAESGSVGSGSSSAGVSSSAAASSSTASNTLQLQSLHLQLPLFEADVQYIANNICNRAPQLTSLALVGYSSRSSSSSSRNSPNAQASHPPHNQAPGANGQQLQQQQQGAQGHPAQQQQQQQNQQQPQQPPGGNDDDEDESQPDAANPSPNYQIIRQGFITGASLQHLLACSSQLQSLTFACRQLYKTSWLAPATGLTSLALRDCSLNTQCLKELVGLKLPRLQHLDLSGNAALGADGASSSCLDLVGKLTRLTHLDISGWELGKGAVLPGAGWQRVVGASGGAGLRGCLLQLSALKQLAELKMEGCGLVAWSAGGSRSSSNINVSSRLLPGLTSLSVANNLLNSNSIAAICGMLQLKQLDLSGVASRRMHGPWQAESASCWAGMWDMPALTELRLADSFWPEHNPRLEFAFRERLCPSIAGMPCLSRLDVSGCQVPYKLLGLLLASLPASVSDIVLDRCVSVTRVDLQALCLLSNLRVLSAAAMLPGLQDKHVEVLSRLTSLKCLVLSGNDVGPKGLAVLVQGLGQLTMLDVSSNPRIKRQGVLCVGGVPVIV